MSQNDSVHAWWSRLRHQGLLLSPVVLLDENRPYHTAPARPPFHLAERLRNAHTRFQAKVGDGELEPSTILAWADALLEHFVGLESMAIARGNHVPTKYTASVRIGSGSQTLRPDRVIFADPGGNVPSLFVMADTSHQIGRGRGRTVYARFLELLRGTGHRLGLMTNGLQFRLVYAGLDFESWAEWESDRWFDDGEGTEELLAFRQLLSPESLKPDKEGRSGLLAAVEESRKRQADLSSVLRENVRQAVEFLLEDVSKTSQDESALFHALVEVGPDRRLSDAEAHEALLQATVRVVMRLVVCLFAESRGLLPVDLPAYGSSYGIRSLYELLEETRQDEGSLTNLANRRMAWPRLMALFRLIHGGFIHGSFMFPAYSGMLFRPGEAESDDPVARALHVLEHEVSVTDATVYAVLRKLLRGPLPVMRGRTKTYVEGPVDYTNLRTEFVGLMYEGLLDYRLKRTNEEIGPQVFLNIGREPVLPLARLEDMLAHDRSGLKDLLTKLKKESVTATVAAEDEGADADAEETSPEAEATEGVAAETEVVVEADSEIADPALHSGDYLDAQDRALRWAREAVVVAGLENRRTARESESAYAERIERAAKRLINRVVATGEFYLVRAGNTRKGSGTFYTKPQLAVPTVHRTLEPLCFDRAAEGTLTPREPEIILGLKVCDPACGSASFLVAALHYLTDALYESLVIHRRIDEPAQARRVTLPFGRPRSGKEDEELLPFPPDDEARGDTFAERVKALLRRHVVERCIYGVDINPLAVEFARVSLWIETFDERLPFSFLNHKVKVGNSLVGCWLDRVEDYPLKAWEREGGDGKSGPRSQRIEEFLKGEKVGNRRSGDGRIKREMKEVIEGRFLGQPSLFTDERTTAESVVAQARADYERLHELPTVDPDARERYYWKHVAGSEPVRRLKRAMDEWCAVWFWPTDEESLPHVPTPLTFHAEPSEARASIIARLSSEIRFFHWELEFPDVFTGDRAGFDASIGNPPWDVIKPSSQEFFTEFDPLYRTYDKQAAVRKQAELFESVPTLAEQWGEYNARFKSLGNWAKNVSNPFDLGLSRGREGASLATAWTRHRQGQVGYANLDHPFRLQGSADLNSYKMFTEGFWNLLRDDGRIGVILPTGIYSDFGTKDLRETLLFGGRLEYLYAFQNEKKVFHAVDHRYKQVALFATRGGSTQAFRTRFRMGVGDSPEAHEIPDDLLRNESAAMLVTPDDVRRNSPKTLSLVELKGDRDLAIFGNIYDHSFRIGDNAPGWEITYATEFHTTNDSRLFPPLEQWETNGYRPDVFGRWVGPDGQITLPLYQGGMAHILNPFFNSWVDRQWRPLTPDASRPVPKFLMGADVYQQNSGLSFRSRIAYRRIARTTDTRTFISTFSPPLPSSDSLFLLVLQSDELRKQLALAAVFSSFCFDWIVRQRLSGTNLSWFVLQECTVPERFCGDNCQSTDVVIPRAARLNLIHRRFAPEWLKLKQRYPQLATREWKRWWGVTVADRLRLRIEIDALCADLYGLDPDDFDYIVREDLTDPKGFYRVDRQLPFRERLTGLAAAGFRALKEGRWSAESAAGLSNDDFFALLGIPELTSAPAAKALGLPGPLIARRDGCHSWHPESFQSDDPRHGWTWDDCWADAVALLGSEEAVRAYLAENKPAESSQPSVGLVPAVVGDLAIASSAPSQQEPFRLVAEGMIKKRQQRLDLTPPLATPAPIPRSKLLDHPDPRISRHLAMLVRIIDAHRGTTQERTLGRKKVEKLSHLIEQNLGIDLGRQPKRAAAGPLDMPHLKAVCRTAEERGIFQAIEPEEPTDEDERGEAKTPRQAVRFEPRERFSQALAEAADVLGDHSPGVDRLMGHLLKLNSDQAEIVATLYAVWQELLASGKSPSNDEIFRAFWAWHPDKARFTQTQLYVEFMWMRQEKIVPGLGKT